MALKNRMPVNELIINAIYKTYNVLVSANHIPKKDKETLATEAHVFYELVSGVGISNYLAKLVYYNTPKNERKSID